MIPLQLVSELFTKQLRAEVKLEDESNVRNSYGVRTYFLRKIVPTDKLVFGVVAERISGKQIHMTMAVFTAQDFRDISNKFSIDEVLTDKQMKSAGVGLPVFVVDKILNEYLTIKGKNNVERK